jgi:hypothetical protein
MARWSEWVTTPSGSIGLVCHTGTQHKCVRCRRPATLQCDFSMGAGVTCDAYLCRICAVPQRPGGLDYCPHHAPRDAA